MGGITIPNIPPRCDRSARGDTVEAGLAVDAGDTESGGGGAANVDTADLGSKAIKAEYASIRTEGWC